MGLLPKRLPNLMVVLPFAGVLLYGVGLDVASPPDAWVLFSAITLASVVGVWVAVHWLAPRFATRKAKAKMWLATYLGWRVTYVPIVVAAAVAGEWSEQLGVWIPLLPAFVWPVSLVVVSLLTWLAVLLANAPLVRLRLWVAALALPPMAAFALISFQSLDDVNPLPDRNWSLPGGEPATGEVTGTNPWTSVRAPGQWWRNVPATFFRAAAAARWEVGAVSPYAWAAWRYRQSELQRMDAAHVSASDWLALHYRSWMAAHVALDRKAGEPDTPVPPDGNQPSSAPDNAPMDNAGENGPLPDATD